MAVFDWMLGARGRRACLILMGAGVLAALALPPIHVVPALLVAFPILVLLGCAPERGRTRFLYGWCFGFGFHLLGLYWITEAILVEAARFWWLVPLAVPALSAVLALFIAVPVWAAGFAPAGWARVVTLTGGWLLADIARQFVATGFPWNPMGSVWALPGFPGDVMIQPAALVSVHGLTLATVFLACSPVLTWRWWAGGLALLLVWAGFGVARIEAPAPPDQPVTVVLVQGNIPQGQKWNRALVDGIFERYLELTAAGVRDAGPGTVVVVWPETASPFQLATDQEARRAIAAAADGQMALVGSVRFDPLLRPRNTLFAVTPDGAVAAAYDKWHLVPFGEYQPDWLPIGIQVVPGGGFARGPGPETLHLPGLPAVGPLICYEVIFPGQVVDEADRPSWMVNVTNDAWFGTSTGPRQHLAAVRMRAVEEGLPLMRAANTGITAAFDARGHEIARLGMERTGYRVVRLPGALPATVFSRYGLVIPIFLGLTAFLVGVWRSISYRRALNPLKG
jgi:apolipoprotein N-acyltransferase